MLDHSGRVRGVLVAALRGAAAHSPDARMLMPVFASHLGLLAERSAAEELRSASYQALVQIGTQIQAVADIEEVLQLIVDRARELMGTDVAWMGLVDERSGMLEMAVASGATTRPFMRMRLRLGDGVGGVVVSTRRPVVLPDYRRESLPTPPEVRDAVLGEGIGSMLSTPMLRGERVIGVLYVGSRHPMQFPATAIALTSALAAQAAVAIENARLYAQLDRKNRLLEESFAIHRVLTDAALAGSGPHEICAELARLLGIELTLVQEVCEPLGVRCRPDGAVITTPGGDPPADGLVFPVVGDTELGRLELPGETELTALQQKALEHGATVIALELVKQRAAQDVAWQLQSDLLGELLDAPATAACNAGRSGAPAWRGSVEAAPRDRDHPGGIESAHADRGRSARARAPSHRAEPSAPRRRSREPARRSRDPRPTRRRRGAGLRGDHSRRDRGRRALRWGRRGRSRRAEFRPVAGVPAGGGVRDARRR